jgi:hypothetical protein
MHDTMIEDQLRDILRTEAESVPLSLTAAELEVRLRLRRSQRTNQRMLLGAAAALVIAVGIGGAVLLANRNSNLTGATSPSPSVPLLAPHSPDASPGLSESPSPAPRLGEPPALDAMLPGEKQVALFETDPSTPVAERPSIPKGTDAVYVDGTCAGRGTLLLEVDGITAQFSCGEETSLGVSEFTLDQQSGVSIQSSVEGNARFRIRVGAVDLDKVPGVDFVPPALKLSGPDWTAADIVTVTGFAGCGLSWAPGDQGGMSEECGPSWQPIAAALHQRTGSQVSLELETGWTITGIQGSFAAQADILSSGRDPQSQPLEVRKVGRKWVFDVPDAGDWGIRLGVSGASNGDHFAVPYYARVVVEP